MNALQIHTLAAARKDGIVTDFETRAEHRADIETIHERVTDMRKSSVRWTQLIIGLIALPSIVAIGAFYSLRSQADDNTRELDQRKSVIEENGAKAEANASAIKGIQKDVGAIKKGVNWIGDVLQIQCDRSPQGCKGMPSRPIVD